MTPDLSTDSLSYVCTVGRGLSTFAQKSIKQIHPAASGFRQLNDGKLLFKIPVGEWNSDFLHRFKCVERVFASLVIKEGPIPKAKRELLGYIFDLAQTISAGMLKEAIAVAEACSLDGYLSESNDSGGDSASAVPSKKPKLEIQDDGNTSVWDFKIFVKIRGRARSRLNASLLASQVSKRMPKIESAPQNTNRPCPIDLTLHINDDLVFMGVCLTDKTLADRSGYIPKPGLRTTVCDAMLQLAQIEPGHAIWDPFVGSGTILLEAAHEFGSSSAIFGSDLTCQPDLWDNLAKNTKMSELFSLFLCDAKNLPFRPATVDRVISDLPFGLKFELNTDFNCLFGEFLERCKTALVAEGFAVLLVSKIQQPQACEIAARLGFRSEKHFVSLGVTDACILVVKRMEKVEEKVAVNSK